MLQYRVRIGEVFVHPPPTTYSFRRNALRGYPVVNLVNAFVRSFSAATKMKPGPRNVCKLDINVRCLPIDAVRNHLDIETTRLLKSPFNTGGNGMKDIVQSVPLQSH
jgi:hypothetical protein